MKPIIFLDNDGVMCLSYEFGGRFKKAKRWNLENPDKFVKYTNDHGIMDVEYRFDNFNKKAVDTLNNILKLTDAEIVVSSDWRFSCTLEEMQDLFKKYGVIKSPIDYTTIDRSNSKFDLAEERSEEINNWLSNNPGVTKWVAIDDLDMSNGLKNFVHCKRINEGIKQSGIQEKIIKFLL